MKNTRREIHGNCPEKYKQKDAFRKEEAIILEWNGAGRVKRMSKESGQKNGHFWGAVDNILGLQGLFIFWTL